MPLSSKKLQDSVCKEEIERRLRYDPMTGKVHRRTAEGGSKPGNIVGCLGRSGYLYARILGKCFLVHRLAWMLHHGEWPEYEIDHKNGIKTDNRIANIRPCDRSQNMWNSKTRADNTTGYKGITFSSLHGKYRARIQLNGKRLHIGLFKTPEEAARKIAEHREAVHGKFTNHG